MIINFGLGNVRGIKNVDIFFLFERKNLSDLINILFKLIN